MYITFINLKCGVGAIPLNHHIFKFYIKLIILRNLTPLTKHLFYALQRRKEVNLMELLALILIILEIVNEILDYINKTSD